MLNPEETEIVLKEKEKVLGKLIDDSLKLDFLKKDYHYRRFLSDLASAYSELLEILPELLEETKKEGEEK